MSYTKWDTPGPYGKTLNEKKRKLHPIEERDLKAEAMYSETPWGDLTPMEQAKRDLDRRKTAQRLNSAAARGSLEEQERLERMYGNTTPGRKKEPEPKSWYRPKLRP